MNHGSPYHGKQVAYAVFVGCFSYEFWIEIFCLVDEIQSFICSFIKWSLSEIPVEIVSIINLTCNSNEILIGPQAFKNPYEFIEFGKLLIFSYLV